MDNRLKRQAALYMLISLVDENNGSIDINSNAIRRLSHRAWHRVMICEDGIQHQRMICQIMA